MGSNSSQRGPTDDPKPSRKLAGAALASALRAMDRVELPRVRKETLIGHRAFLLWAMAGGPTYPNGRALLDTVAGAVGVSASNFRLDHKNKSFDKRLSGHADPGAVAYVTYRRHYLLDVKGADMLAVIALLDPPPDSVPELWRWSATRLAEDLAERRDKARATREEQFRAAISDAAPLAFGKGHKRNPNRRPVDLDAVKPAAGIDAVVGGDESSVAKLVLDAAAKQPKGRGAILDARQRAAEAVARAARRTADAEKAGGDKVVLTRQDARNILRSIVGTPLDEKSLREVDRELLVAARAASPDAEVRLLSLLATQRAEAEAAAADPTDRLVKLVDAAFGYFARELGAGKVKVTMSSLPMLIKARALLTGGATSRTEHTGLLDARGGGLRDSARVADARQSGDKTALVRAMREDVSELSVILDALGEVGDEPAARDDGKGPTVIDVASEPVDEPKAGEG